MLSCAYERLFVFVLRSVMSHLGCNLILQRLDDLRLRIDAPLLDGVGYAVDGQHVGGDAVVDGMGFSVADYVFKTVGQDGFKLLIDGVFLPEITLAILDPFKV